VSESKHGLGPDDPAYYAPRRLRDIGVAADKDWRTSTGEPQPQIPASQALAHVPPPHFRPTRTGEGRSHSFDDALAKVLREQLEAEQAGPGLVRERRSSLRGLASSAIAGMTAGVVALTYFTLIAPQPGLSGNRIWAALGSSPAVSSVPIQRKASTLVVRNQSGLANDLLELGVSVTAPSPGATVAIRGLPDTVKLTAQARKSADGWRVRAEDVSDVKVIPPTDFVGDMNLSVELRDPNDAALATSDQQLSWKPAHPAAEAVALVAAVPAVAPAPPAAPAAPPPPAAAVQPSIVVASASPTVDEAPPRKPAADQTRETSAPDMSANEIAIAIRRAQELLAGGDVKAARALLQRAAEAHDARAALALAKTFDPAVSRATSLADRGGPDAEQARNWYQRAREWGSPEAQRLLDALASYQR
jgi:hypothetical protein